MLALLLLFKKDFLCNDKYKKKAKPIDWLSLDEAAIGKIPTA
jgi:hypothetical protein